MKNLLIIEVGYFDKNQSLSKEAENIARRKLFNKGLKLFKEEFGDLLVNKLKIVKDLFPRPEIIVEYLDSDLEMMIGRFRKSKSVEIIDYNVPDNNVKTLTPKEQVLKKIQDMMSEKVLIKEK